MQAYAVHKVENVTTSIKRFNTKIVLSERGVTLQKRFSGRKLKFLAWEEIKAVGFYVGYVPAMGVDVCTLYPKVLPEFYVSYYDDLKKIQNQRVAAIIAGKKITPAVEKKYIEVKKDLVELMSSIHLNATRVEQLVEQLNTLNNRLMGLEGKLMRYALSCRIKREDFLEAYQCNFLVI